MKKDYIEAYTASPGSIRAYDCLIKISSKTSYDITTITFAKLLRLFQGILKICNSASSHREP